MLINRRQALVSMALTALSGVAWSLPGPVRRTLWKGAQPSLRTYQTLVEETVDERLREDLARLAPRAYSEEGIPVFLACVNLVPEKALGQGAKVSLTPLSGNLASSFRRR